MRRQYFYWAYLVTALVISVYGGYIVFYNLNNKKDVPVLGLVFFIAGIVLLLIYLILFIISFIQKKNRPINNEVVEVKEKEEEIKPEIKEEPKPEVKEEPKPRVASSPRRDIEYRSMRKISRPVGGSAYIKRVGYGLVLRVEEEEILDMRTNTYYRIEGNMVKRSGSGPVFEISGNSIRAAFGSYLYEISGGNVNKVFGGLYASISGNYLTVFDLSEKYEITDSLNRKQLLVVVALLFGAY